MDATTGKIMEIYEEDWLELKYIATKWLRRRKRLGKNAEGLHKIGAEANKLLSRELLGKFNEIEKCRSELVMVINRIDKSSRFRNRKNCMGAKDK